MYNSEIFIMHLMEEKDPLIQSIDNKLIAIKQKKEQLQFARDNAKSHNQDLKAAILNTRVAQNRVIKQRLQMRKKSLLDRLRGPKEPRIKEIT